MDTLSFILESFGLKKGKASYDIGRSRTGSLIPLINNLGFKIGAEIGVGTGLFSKLLFSLNQKLKLYAVGAWDSADTYEKAKNRLASFNCIIFKRSPIDAAKKFPVNSLDFVFINNVTDYKTARENIAVWAPKVKKGGIVAGIGYGGSLFSGDRGIKRAVDQLVRRNKIKPLFVLKKDFRPTWFYVKNV